MSLTGGLKLLIVVIVTLIAVKEYTSRSLHYDNENIDEGIDENDVCALTINVSNSSKYTSVRKRAYPDDCRIHMTCLEEWNHRKMKYNRTINNNTSSKTNHEISMYVELFLSYTIFFSMQIFCLLHLINCSQKPAIDCAASKSSRKKSKKKWNRQFNSVANIRPPTQSIFVYTVPRYPDNHNPLLPLRLQQQLDDMNPREFLTYVLKELTLEERESLMVDERQRRKTFLVSWPYDDQRSGIKMAQAGFYSLDAYDRVQCVFCRGSLHRWDSGDTPMIEHARSFTFCRFVKGLECGNREYRTNALSKDDMRNITKFNSAASNYHSLRPSRDGISIDSSILGISTNRASTIQYAPMATRSKTYARWPASCPITATRMCEAGFFFTGFDDQVRCFYCSGGIKQWGEKDDPWEEHARWFPDCAFLVQQKGQSYIDEVHARTPSDKKSVRKTQSQKKDELSKAETINSQKFIIGFCSKLGHHPVLISKAVSMYNKPFDDIRDLIELLYNLEDTEGIPSTPSSPKSMLKYDTKAMCPQEDLLLQHQHQQKQLLPGRFDGSEDQRKRSLGCVICERKTDTFVPATQIGLPCGHLIFCDNCNSEEAKQTKVSCPLKSCHTPLTGTMKIYFA